MSGPAIAQLTTPALIDVSAERRRQIDKGFSLDRDDRLFRNQLLRAAIAYQFASLEESRGWADTWWPWAKATFKPKDRRRDLVRAAALLLAEIERLDRAG